MIEETKQGLNIEIVDQDGRSMFPEGSKEPYERTRRLVQKLAPAAQGDAVPALDHRPHRGEPHSAAPGYGPWDLSADRANAVRQILEEKGCRLGHIFMVAGKADTQPLFPDDPFMAANRRVTITLMREAPPLPVDFSLDFVAHAVCALYPRPRCFAERCISGPPCVQAAVPIP